MPLPRGCARWRTIPTCGPGWARPDARTPRPSPPRRGFKACVPRWPPSERAERKRIASLRLRRSPWGTCGPLARADGLRGCARSDAATLRELHLTVTIRARHLVICLATLVALAIPAIANASPQAVIRDCAEDGVLDHHYSNSDLQKAKKKLPSDLDEYSDCREVIGAAI